MALGILRKISKTAYQAARKKVAADTRIWRAHNRNPKKRKRGMSLPAGTPRAATNRDRAVIEVYKFQNRTAAKPFVGYLQPTKITNWTGLRLCTITKKSETSRTVFGGHRTKRVAVTASCIDGRKYVGTGSGNGMSIRLRPKKGR